MKIDKLIYDFKELLLQYSDDSEYDDRYILHLYNLYRAEMIRQDLNAIGKSPDVSSIQTLTLNLEVVNNDRINNSSFTLLRTIDKLPSFIELHHRVCLEDVYTTDFINTKFDIIQSDKASFINGCRFKNNAVFAYLDEHNHLCLYSTNRSFMLLNTINVRGIFNDPLELENYNVLTNNNVLIKAFDENIHDYPLQEGIINQIKPILLTTVLKLKGSVVEDEINDGTNTKIQ